MLKKLMVQFILIADTHPTVWEKVGYGCNVITKFGIVAYLLSSLSLWFSDNHQFVTFITTAIVINAIVGGYFHTLNKTFSWEQFIKQNSKMILVIIISYILLEQLRLTAGDNLAGDVFKIVVQVATLLYPTSKALKNTYLLSNKQFPPAFMMQKLYNFERTGNVKEFFGNDQAEMPGENQEGL
jgi:hypothetical protein